LSKFGGDNQRTNMWSSSKLRQCFLSFIFFLIFFFFRGKRQIRRREEREGGREGEKKYYGSLPTRWGKKHKLKRKQDTPQNPNERIRDSPPKIKRKGVRAKNKIDPPPPQPLNQKKIKRSKNSEMARRAKLSQNLKR